VQIFLTALLLLISITAHAQIGSITEFSGSATIKRGKDSIAAQKGTAIEQNDKIETKNGKLKIVFKDDTQVSVTEHSSLVIDDFVYDPKSGKGNLGIKAAGGTVRYVSGALAKDPKQVKISTPTAAIAVRGTDFVMSVNETGGSMVILMPSCDWATSAIKGISCSSGKIDVESGTNIVSMNRPYQATLVETAGQPPTPPITVNLFGTAIGNNLQIAPPRTMAGRNVVAAARAAAAATGVTKENKKESKEDKEDKEDNEDNSSSEAEMRQVAEKSEDKEVADETDKKIAVVAEEKEEVKATATQASSSEKENLNLFPLYADKSKNKQIGWMYESVSGNGRNYANVTQVMGSQIQVSITQDMQTVSHNFSSGRAIGSITIIQTSR